jgi:hypothetical protein
MFVLLVCFTAGDYFFLALGIRFLALAGIFGSLSSDIPERVDDPSMPTRISGDPILIDEFILFAVGVLTLL